MHVFIAGVRSKPPLRKVRVAAIRVGKKVGVEEEEEKDPWRVREFRLENYGCWEMEG